MKKCLISTLSVMIIVAISVICINAIPKKLDEDEYYVYPMTSSHENWKKLTIEEKYEVCRIPKRIVKNMSDKQLIQAIVDFPFIHEVYLYNDIKTGVKALEKVSDAYAELISRETGYDSLMNYLKQESAKMDDEMTADLELKIEQFAAMILFQEKFQDSLTESDVEFILSVSKMVDDQYNKE